MKLGRDSELRFVFASGVAGRDQNLLIGSVLSHFLCDRFPDFFLMEFDVALVRDIPAEPRPVMTVTSHKFIDNTVVEINLALPVIETPVHAGIEKPDEDLHIEFIGFMQNELQKVIGIVKCASHDR